MNLRIAVAAALALSPVLAASDSSVEARLKALEERPECSSSSDWLERDADASKNGSRRIKTTRV